MTKRTRNTILATIAVNTGCNSRALVQSFGRRRITERFDNTILRYVRHMYAKGLLVRTSRGEYALKPNGRRFIAKVLK